MKGEKVADNSTASYAQIERALRILEVLRENTDTEDDEHRLSQTELREGLSGESGFEITGNKRTVRNTIRQLISALNPPVYDDNDDEYRILYNGYERDRDDENHTITGLRYVQDFSYAELDAIIDSLRQSIRLNETEREELIKKVEEKLGNKYYRERIKRRKESSTQETSVDVLSARDDELVARNICIIREAIDRKKKISFYFNVLTKKHGSSNDYELKPKENEKGEKIVYRVSPYHLVEYDGQVYMVCNTDSGKSGAKGYDNASHYRLDLMTEVKIAKEGRKPENEITGLPSPWNPREYMYQHLYMFYGEPRWVDLRVNKRSMYIIRDKFGDNTRNLIDEGETNTLSVYSDPDAVVVWALTLGGYVEILDEKVREKVREKIGKLEKRYVT